MNRGKKKKRQKYQWHLSKTNKKTGFEHFLVFLGLLLYIQSSHNKPKQFIVNLWKVRAKLSKHFVWKLLALGSVTAFSFLVGLLASEAKVSIIELEVYKCWYDLHCHEHFISLNIRNRNH